MSRPTGCDDMALARVRGAVIDGVAGVNVLVEADVASGLPSVGMVGLAGATVAEARWRVRSAVGNSGLPWPRGRITIGLSPADIPKIGTGLDLPVAVALLRAGGQVPEVGDAVFIGELGLDGQLRATAGALPAALAAHAHGHRVLYVSRADEAVVRLLPDMVVHGVDDLRQLVAILRGEREPSPSAGGCGAAADIEDAPDLSEVRGHAMARFGLEVAAAGGHHLAMVGAPGVGKSMLALRLASVLPDLADDEALEVTALHSLMPRGEADFVVQRRPPVQMPHHSSSAASLLGTARGARVVPGAVTLAHRGVLVLDEAPEFSRPSLEGLRQPLEQGSIAVHRVGRAAQLPARFQLVLTANPCPCGLSVGLGAECSCPPVAKRRYAERLSGPLMDRIDVRLTVARPSLAELAVPSASSAEVRERVEAARDRARLRFVDEGFALNARIPGQLLRSRWAPDPEAADLLDDSLRNGGSLRGVDRVLRMAWTIADLRGQARPKASDVVMALGLRSGETAPTA